MSSVNFTRISFANIYVWFVQLKLVHKKIKK